jgi:hypothetical protein
MNKQKYIIEIIEVLECPVEWVQKSGWPGPGIYKVKGESTAMYHVQEHGVNYISFPDVFVAQPHKESGESVSESLLLKAIAAASRAETLK